MSDSYNSKLISKLYKTTDFDDFENILDEIEEIKSPVFLYPLYDVYLINKNESFAHYFISAIDSIDDPDVLSVLLNIIKDPDIKDSKLFYTLPYLQKRGYFDEDFINYLKNIFLLKIEQITGGEKFSGFDSYDFEHVMEYFKEAKLIGEYQVLLSDLFENDSIDKAIRSIALSKFLNLDATNNLQYLITNYESLSEEAVNILSKELSRWNQGKKVVELRNIIFQKGNSRAKEIIKAQLDSIEKKEKQNIQEESKEYSNGKMVSEINTLIEEINFMSDALPEIGFPLFVQNGSLLVKQIMLANDKKAIKACCTSLRSMMYGIAENTINHGLNYEEQKKLLPDDTADGDYNKPLNRLYLFLKAKNFNIDDKVFGLRDLNNALTQIGAHEGESSSSKHLISSLNKIQALPLFAGGKWQELHRHLLIMYKKSLTEIKSELMKERKN